jgi:hypothetical protein
MAVGEGKYDFALTLALGNAEAEQGVLLVLDGNKGAGFSVQASMSAMSGLPDALENIAKEIRKDLLDLT